MKRLVALLALSLAACTPAAAYVGTTPTTPPVTTTSVVVAPGFCHADCGLDDEPPEHLIAAEQAGMVALWIALGRPCAPTAVRSADGGCEPSAVLGTALSCTSQGCVER